GLEGRVEHRVADPPPGQGKAEDHPGQAMGGLRGNGEEQRAGGCPVRTHRRPMLAAVRADLAERLIEASELHGAFVVPSGRRSTVYFDKFRFLADPELLRELATAVRELLPEGVTHLAAPEGAAMLLLSAVALEAGLPMVVIRKEPKAYGTRAQVEGLLEAGARVALLEDVSTT